MHYVPSLKVPKKNIEYAYGHILLDTVSQFDDWKGNVVNWTRSNGMGLFVCSLQSEYTTCMGYLHYLHKRTNEKWISQALTELCDVSVYPRYRKISKTTENDATAVHIECDRDQAGKVRDILRETFTKDDKRVEVTGFSLMFVPDRIYLNSNMS